ncbi:hypothetical protein [Pseudomonas phage 71PfluR64PP]|uniref:Uncharacterized protein n=1 Tax=Pseudomonas phage 71PfluR64PP TaxID=2163977 RepID=A0A3G6V4D4_9CAUD|nr:hypothetical protein [Pseudomonas phage 71PfluR64PP]
MSLCGVFYSVVTHCQAFVSALVAFDFLKTLGTRGIACQKLLTSRQLRFSPLGPCRVVVVPILQTFMIVSTTYFNLIRISL